MSDVAGSTGAPRTVLLVEDHVDSRVMYAEFLRLDFHVVEAGDGLAALELIEQARPDVVVTDLALPRMDGFELIARIRGDDRLRQRAGDRAQWLCRDGARGSGPRRRVGPGADEALPPRNTRRGCSYRYNPPKRIVDEFDGIHYRG